MVPSHVLLKFSRSVSRWRREPGSRVKQERVIEIKEYLLPVTDRKVQSLPSSGKMILLHDPTSMHRRIRYSQPAGAIVPVRLNDAVPGNQGIGSRRDGWIPYRELQNNVTMMQRG